MVVLLLLVSKYAIVGVSLSLKLPLPPDMARVSDQGGFPITSIREIRILRSLTHANIVELLEVVTDSHGKVQDGKVPTHRRCPTHIVKLK